MQSSPDLEVESEEIGDLHAGVLVLMDSELQVLGDLSVLLDLSEHLEALLDDVLLDDLEDLVLLERLTGNVKGHIFGIDNTLDEAEPFGDELVTVVHDEDTTDVQLDVVLLLLGLEEIKGSSLGNEKESAELEGAFNGEVLHGEVLFPIVGEGLVESGVLVFGDVLG